MASFLPFEKIGYLTRKRIKKIITKKRPKTWEIRFEYKYFAVVERSVIFSE
jgi:hypothetical protein